VVSATLLLIEHDELGHALKVQQLIYFISEVLLDFKTKYL
jgi:hypothetical protein